MPLHHPTPNWDQLSFRLVELIVLNIGLQANILDTRLFSMFVVMAIILTVMTVGMHPLAMVSSLIMFP